MRHGDRRLPNVTATLVGTVRLLVAPTGNDGDLARPMTGSYLSDRCLNAV